MDKPLIGIVLSTTRQNRFADRVGAWILDIAERRKDMNFELVDLRDYPLPFFDEAASPVYVPPANEIAKRWGAKLAALDAFIFVTAEYNRSIPGVLKNALDHAYFEFNRKPAAYVGYGGTGASRAIEHLRTVCVELQMVPLRNGVHIGMEPFLAVLQAGKALADFEYLNKSAEAMLDELGWWAKALRAAREAT